MKVRLVSCLNINRKKNEFLKSITLCDDHAVIGYQRPLSPKRQQERIELDIYKRSFFTWNLVKTLRLDFPYFKYSKLKVLSNDDYIVLALNFEKILKLVFIKRINNRWFKTQEFGLELSGNEYQIRLKNQILIVKIRSEYLNKFLIYRNNNGWRLTQEIPYIETVEGNNFDISEDNQKLAILMKFDGKVKIMLYQNCDNLFVKQNELEFSDYLANNVLKLYNLSLNEDGSKLVIPKKNKVSIYDDNYKLESEIKLGENIEIVEAILKNNVLYVNFNSRVVTRMLSIYCNNTKVKEFTLNFQNLFALNKDYLMLYTGPLFTDGEIYICKFV